MSFAKETELAGVVVSWLRSEGWQVWQEVDGYYDILAVLGARMWSIETKLSFGLPVVAQAWERSRHVHWASVAVPAAARDRAPRMLDSVCGHYGIGVLLVGLTEVEVRLPPALHRKQGDAELRARLAGIPQDFAPAGQSGSYWTGHKGTSQRLAEYVGRHPGSTVKEVVAAIDHHYRRDSTARARIASLALDGVYPGVRVEREGKLLRLYPGAK